MPVAVHTYDPTYRLRIVTDGAITWSYQYNGAGDAIARAVGDTATEYTLDTINHYTVTAVRCSAGRR